MNLPRFLLYMRYGQSRPSDVSEARWGAMVKHYRKYGQVLEKEYQGQGILISGGKALKL
jgi:hypothetical protein